MNDWVVAWKVSANSLVAARFADLNEPPLAPIRADLTREMADNYIRSQRDFLAERQVRRVV